MSERVLCRMRITFREEEAIKYISHLDLLRAWERTFRRAGLPLGPASVIDAIRAVEMAGIGARADFYWALHSIFVTRREHHAVFDEAFRLFWRRPSNLENLLSNIIEHGDEREDTKSSRAAASRAAAPGGPSSTSTRPGTSPSASSSAVAPWPTSTATPWQRFAAASARWLARTAADNAGTTAAGRSKASTTPSACSSRCPPCCSTAAGRRSSEPPHACPRPTAR